MQVATSETRGYSVCVDPVPVRLSQTETWLMPFCCHQQRGGHTYVLESAGRIKIGKSARIASRLAELRAVNAHDVNVLGLARGPYLEAKLHELCSEWHIHNEWFRAEAWNYLARLFIDPRACASCLLEVTS